MYNEEIKERFAKSYTEKPAVRKHYRRLFDISQRYEEERGSDLYTMNAKDIETIIVEASGVSSQSLKTNLQLIKAYIKWCDDQGFHDVCREILQTKSVISEKMKATTVTSPAHLQKYLDSVFSPEDDDTIDVVYRTYFWLAYAGIVLDDIFKITEKDVSFEDMTIKYGGVDYPIYREGLKAIRKCITLDHINVYNHSRTTPSVLNRFDSNILMRGGRCLLTKDTTKTMVNRKQRDAKQEGKTSISMGFFKVWISGLFYRMYMDELAGIKPDFLPLVKKIDSAKENKNEYPDINRRAKLYHEDYLTWKSLLNK